MEFFLFRSELFPVEEVYEEFFGEQQIDYGDADQADV